MVTRTRVAAVVMIPLAILLGILGGHYWHVTHTPQAVTLADQPASPAQGQPSTPSTSATSLPPTPTAPVQPTEQAKRDAGPVVAALPKPEPTKPEAKNSEPTKPAAAASDAKTPTFDIVRVEPKGDTVVAGKGAPDAKVALLSGGKVVGEATSDANGQFVILPERLAPGDHALTLRQTPNGQPASESKQSVAVSVPQPSQAKSKVVVALAEPGKATKLLSPPPGAASGSPLAAPGGKVVIRSAELENGSGLYVSGAAQAGTSVHVYLNDSHIADVVAGADGAWSVRVKHGLTGGHYAVRADAAAPSGKVASRAEVPFDVPSVMAEAATPRAAPSAAMPSSPALRSSPPAASSSPPAAAAPHAAETQPGAATPPAAAAPHAAEAQPGSAAPPAASQPQTAETQPSPSAPSAADATRPTAAAPGASGADAVIETVATARVTAGDNLWNISRTRLGEGMRYTQIYAANSDQIRDPNLIYPGQVFVVPSR